MIQSILTTLNNIYIDNFYIYTQLKFNDEFFENSKFLNERIREVANDVFETPTKEDLRIVKCKVIEEYKQIKNNNKIQWEGEKIVLAAKSAQNKMYIDLMPDDVIKVDDVEFIELNKNKTEYIQRLKVSEKKEDKKTLKFLELESLKSLAQKFDTEMNKELSLRDFAKMLVECEKDLLNILLENVQKNSNSSEVGDPDEMNTICEAFFLLQTNTKFEKAFNVLLEKFQDKDYVSLEAVINHYKGGMLFLKNGSFA